MAFKQKTRKEVLIEIASTKFSATVTTTEAKAVAYLKSARKYMEKLDSKNAEVKTTLITTLVPVTVVGLDGKKRSFATIELAQTWINGAIAMLNSINVKYEIRPQVNGWDLDKAARHLFGQLDEFKI